MSPRRKTDQGQTLVEGALLFPLFFALFLGCLSFAQWFLIREQLILAVQEGALLYSSGRIPASEVKQRMQRSLRHGHPTLEVPIQQIYVGRSPAVPLGRLHQLDMVRVTYRPPHRVLHLFQIDTMEESCTIKHAPPYWGPFWFKLGPPVEW